MATKVGAKKGKADPPARTPARRASFNAATGKMNEDEDDKMAVRDKNTEIDIPGQNVASRYSSQANFSREEIIMPKLRLGQSMTREVQDREAELGQWLAGIGEEPIDSVVIIPMVYARGQILNEDDTIVCSSQDAITGYGDPGGNCKMCPRNQWTKGKGGKNNPPDCTFYFDYGIWSITHETMMTWLLKSTALKVAQQVNSYVMKFGFGNFAIELGSIVQPGVQGKFAVPTIKIAKVSEKDLANAREQFSFGG